MLPSSMLEVLLGSTHDVVVVVDADRRISCWNEAATRVLGWTREEAIGRDAVELLTYGQSESASFCDSKESGNHVFRARDGGRRLLQLEVSPVERSLVLVGKSLDERERLRDRVAEAQKLSGLPLVASGVSHDLNNLLALVGSALELARKHVQRGNDPTSVLEEAHAAVMRAGHLNRQLATLLRHGSPSADLHSLEAVVTDTASFTLIGRETRLALAVERPLWPTRTDAVQISQVVQNLVSNAADAMEGRGAISLEVKNAEEAPEHPERLHRGRHVVMRVRDLGPGIPVQHRSRLFEPFFTTKANGSGLGLAITAEIVRAHDGFIVVQSEEGVGSLFEVWLPSRARESSGGAERPD